MTIDPRYQSMHQKLRLKQTPEGAEFWRAWFRDHGGGLTEAEEAERSRLEEPRPKKKEETT